jgi:hypothetical protein
MHDFGFVKESAFFSLLAGRPLFAFSLSFYILGNPNPFSTK